MDVATNVLVTVNAPHGASVSAHQLAMLIADPKSVTECNAAVFSFFSEIDVSLQKAFINAMGVNEADSSQVAAALAELSGYELPLAA
jgi:hypothetical protein